jgi:hypothetical protein
LSIASIGHLRQRTSAKFAKRLAAPPVSLISAERLTKLLGGTEGQVAEFICKFIDGAVRRSKLPPDGRRQIVAFEGASHREIVVLNPAALAELDQ